MNLPATTLEAARVLWAYHRLDMPLRACEVILVFGSNDLRVAAHAAELYHRKMAPWMLFSGARGRMTMDWPETEAEAMARVARSAGVPDSAILLEIRATHTGENIRFSRELLARNGLTPRSAVLVQKPYMERRAIAALTVQWPDTEFIASSPPLSFDDYCTADLPPALVISAMVGDFQRLLDYPALGFSAPQVVPDYVMASYRHLVACGFTDQMA